MDKLGVEEVEALLEEIVASKPDGYKYEQHDGVMADGGYYPTCTYFWKGCADCIIGHLLARLGFGPDDIGYGRIVEGCERGKAEAYRPAIAARFTAEAVVFMQRVQTEQDRDATWRNALNTAKEEMK